MILGPCIDIFVGGSNDRQCSQKTQHRRQRKHDLRGKSARQQDEHLTPLLYTFICQPFSFKQVPNFECDFIYIYIRFRVVLSSHHSWSTCGFCHVTHYPRLPNIVRPHPPPLKLQRSSCAKWHLIARDAWILFLMRPSLCSSDIILHAKQQSAIQSTHRNAFGKCLL